MSKIKATATALGMLMLASTLALAEVRAPEEEEAIAPAPSWEALAENAHELALERYSPEDLAAQIDKKQEHLGSLYEQRAALEAQLVAVISATKKSLDEIKAIDDPIVRGESLLRFRSSKNIRLKTVRATLDAVNDAIDRESRELLMLQRLLQGRRAEARLYGSVKPQADSYEAYLAQEAARVLSSEEEVLRRLRDDRLEGLERVILPLLEPRVPDLTSAVLEGATL